LFPCDHAEQSRELLYDNMGIVNKDWGRIGYFHGKNIYTFSAIIVFRKSKKKPTGKSFIVTGMGEYTKSNDCFIGFWIIGLECK